MFTPSAAALAAAFWPGPLTLVLRGGEGRLPDELRGREGGIAVRHTSHAGIARLVAATGKPLTSTSANRPGRSARARAPTGIRELFGPRSAARRAAGARRRRARQRAAVHAGGLHRAGAAAGARGRDSARRAAAGGREVGAVRRRGEPAPLRLSSDMHILFVCTGNTCRSPMAEAPAAEALGRARHRSGDGRVRRHRRVGRRAGLRGRLPGGPGARAGPERAPRAAPDPRPGARGRSDPRHVGPPSRPGRPSWAESTRCTCSAPTPGARPARSEVTDPFGSDLASYRTTFGELQELIGGVVSRVAGMVR